MDPDGIEKNKKFEKEGNQNVILQGYVSDAGNVFSSSWIRRSFSFYDEYNRVILGGRYRILWYLKSILAILYFAYEIYK
jgi:hypothetical protein